MSKIRNRYNKGKKVRGRNALTNELGLWRRTQVIKRMSKADFEKAMEDEKNDE